MAHIIIDTSAEDQEKVLAVLKELNEATTPVATIAKMANIKASTARYVLLDLIEAGKIQRVPTRAINKHYVRYGYKIL